MTFITIIKKKSLKMKILLFKLTKLFRFSNRKSYIIYIGNVPLILKQETYIQYFAYCYAKKIKYKQNNKNKQQTTLFIMYFHHIVHSESF